MRKTVKFNVRNRLFIRVMGAIALMDFSLTMPLLLRSVKDQGNKLQITWQAYKSSPKLSHALLRMYVCKIWQCSVLVTCVTNGFEGDMRAWVAYTRRNHYKESSKWIQDQVNLFLLKLFFKTKIKKDIGRKNILIVHFLLWTVWSIVMKENIGTLTKLALWKWGHFERG